MTTVQDIFNINPQKTKYNIITDNEYLWSGTELHYCQYRQNEVYFMRYVGNPYSDGYIELKIDKFKGE